MSIPSPITQETTPLRGTIRGHALKRELPSATGGNVSDWMTLEVGETWNEETPQSCHLVADSNPLKGDQVVLVAFDTGGEMTGPLRFRPAPEYSAAKVIRAAQWKQRLRTFFALSGALGFMAATAYLGATWLTSGSYGWMAGGLVMAMASVFHIRSTGMGLWRGIVSLYHTKLPDTLPLTVHMAQPEEVQQAA